MKSIKQFKIGSSVFFNSFDDFCSSDNDELHIMDSFITSKTNVLNLKSEDKDIFFYRNMSKDEFIIDAIESNVPMRVGKFLVPEFCEYIGFTIQDYEQLEDMFNNLDTKHRYEKSIRDAYIQNNAFILTDEQRLSIYEEYKLGKIESKKEKEAEFNEKLKNLLNQINKDFPNEEIYLVGSTALYLQNIEINNKLPQDIDLVFINSNINWKTIKQYKRYYRDTFKLIIDISKRDKFEYKTIIIKDIPIKVIDKDCAIEYKQLIVNENLYPDIKIEKHKQHLEYLKNTNQI